MGCKDCRGFICHDAPGAKLPADCPGQETALQAEALAISRQEPDYSLLQVAAQVEAAGYCRWTRVEETMEFARRLGYQRLGIAFCYGLRQEAATLAGILTDNGFTVVAAICKNGGIAKAELALPPEYQLHPEAERETMCNPVGQALYLAKEQTQLNILLGLCVGHDAVFLRHSAAPTTVLVVKDRVLCHNPAGALYQAQGYYRAKMFPSRVK